MPWFLKNKATGAEVPPADIDVSDDHELIEVAASENRHGSKADSTPVIPSAADSPEFAKLRGDFEAAQAKIAALEATERQARVDAITAAAKASAGLQAKNLISTGVKGLAGIRAYAGLSAAGLPTDGIDLEAAVKDLEAGLVPHRLTAPAIADAGAASLGVIPLANGSAGSDGKPSPDRIKELLAGHPNGAAALRHLNGTK